MEPRLEPEEEKESDREESFREPEEDAPLSESDIQRAEIAYERWLDERNN
jgi:hypothetical protein